MTTRDYNRVTLDAFVSTLIECADLDPIYSMLERAELPTPQLHAFLVAYWCYYSAATAARIVEAEVKWPGQFYHSMHVANRYNWPHGFERRHFRGEAAVSAIRYMEQFGSPTDIINYFTTGSLMFDDVSARVQTFPMFGPWIAWKVADMLERVLHLPVDFSNATLGLYHDPVKGAALLLKGSWKEPISDTELSDVVNCLIQRYNHYKAPPLYDRPVNVQEVETILCKYKAHVKGFYPLYNDSREIAHALKTAAAQGSGMSQMLLEELITATRLVPLPINLREDGHG